MFLPIRTDRPLRHTPRVNIALIVLNIVAFVVQRAWPTFEANLLLYPQQPTLLGFFGSAFLHADWFHLGGNMLFLYIFGNNLNDKLGHAAFLALYLGGALCAGLLHAAISDAPVLGASGAIAAVTGAYLVMFPRSRVAVLILFFLITIVHIPALWLIGLFFVFDLFQGLMSEFGGGFSGTAHFAHIGGTLYGAGAGLLLMRTKLIDRDQMDLLAMIRRWRLRRQHASGLKKMGQAHQSQFDIVPAAAADPKVLQMQDLRDGINAAFERDNLREAGRLYSQLLRVDDAQVLSMQRQLDVANQLAADRKYAEAAAAYERFLERYHRHEQYAQTQLMLGLIYARYLARPGPARQHLQAALAHLADPEEREIAVRELDLLGEAPAQ